jgi:hypothetical protein
MARVTFKEDIEEYFKKDIKTARQCLEYKGFHCESKSCLNESCPLHRSVSQWQERKGPVCPSTR